MKSYEDTFFIDRELFNFLFLYLIIVVIYQLNAFQAITIHDSRSNKLLRNSQNCLFFD